MKARTCWPALESKTEQLLSQLRLATGQARRLRESLMGSQQRLDQMYQEYHAQSLAPGMSNGMADTLNQRRFMAQLLALRERVLQDLERSNQQLSLLEQRTLTAQAQKMKIETLVKIDAKALQQHVRTREQGALDELGVLRFNRAGNS